MADVTDEELEAAEERGRIAMPTEPRAKAARYDPQLRQVEVRLVNGCTFLVPPRLVQGLENPSGADRATVETGPFGFGLHRENRDVDATVAGLMAGRFGTARDMADRFGARWNAVAAG